VAFFESKNKALEIRFMGIEEELQHMTFTANLVE
jgi:hypothetical protein